MNFGEAIIALKLGQRVSRAGWNGKGMWLSLVGAEDWRVVAPPSHSLGWKKQPFIMMKTADNLLVPWLASQSDVLGEDWGVVT